MVTVRPCPTRQLARVPPPMPLPMMTTSGEEDIGSLIFIPDVVGRPDIGAPRQTSGRLLLLKRQQAYSCCPRLPHKNSGSPGKELKGREKSWSWDGLTQQLWFAGQLSALPASIQA